jgi:hypothetical protein
MLTAGLPWCNPHACPMPAMNDTRAAELTAASAGLDINQNPKRWPNALVRSEASNIRRNDGGHEQECLPCESRQVAAIPSHSPISSCR